LPSLQPNNRVYKQKVGELIFPYVAKIASIEKAPKLTGILIELPLEQVKEYLESY
jgi:5,10-methylene-tetrahydrofolate dehydrogenase/methenyl tetrahydrofolate cyclohydrolase